MSTTGVAGLTLGGGLGWLMPKHGMALDNLISAEMVLADGRIVRAAADENADLFWAARGGGGNFGVASSLEFRLHEVGPMVTGGLVAWPVDRARDVLRLYRELALEAGDDLMLVAGLITGPDQITKLVAIVAGFFGRGGDGEKAINPIKSFGQPVHGRAGADPLRELNAMLDASYPRGARNYWKAHFCEGTGRCGASTPWSKTSRRALLPMGQILIERFHGAATRVPPSPTPPMLCARKD